jgi:hypothetical protein
VTTDEFRGEAGARQALPWLEALEAVAADPVRLVRLVHDADDREDAVRAVAAAFDLTPEQAAVVLDNQVGRLVRSSRAVLAEELRVLRAPWGEPVGVRLRVRGRRSAVLDLDGEEHRFRAGGLQSLLDQVTRFLQERVVRPDVRPVFLSTDLDDGPSLIRLWPGGSGEYEYPEDATGWARVPRLPG